MKRLILILFFVSVVSASALTRQELEAQIRKLVKDQQVELDTAKQRASEAVSQIDVARKQVEQVTTERDGWRDYGNDQHEKFINAEKRVAEVTVKKQRWMMMFFGLCVLAACYIGLKLSPIGRLIP